jgi:hypothetical protein
MPGSLFGALVSDALSVGTPHYPVTGPQYYSTTESNARPPAVAKEFFTGPVLPAETPTAKVPSAKASADGSDTSARRKRSLDDLLPDWLERVSVAPAWFFHTPPLTSRGEPSVVGPVEFAAVPNVRGGGQAPAAGTSASEDESVAVQPVRTYSASMMMSSGSALATVTAYDPEAAELVNPPGPTTGLFEFVRGDGTYGDVEVVFRIGEGAGQASLATDYGLVNEGKPVPVEHYVIGGQAGLYGVVTIPSAQSSTAVRVVVADDQEVEPTEAAGVTVVQVAGVDVPTADQTSAVVSIADNDPMAAAAQTVWVGRVDATAQENYESFDQWNAGKIELRRSVASGMLSVNYDATAGTATLNGDYSLWGPVASGYYNQISYTKLSGTGKVTFAGGQDRLWVDVKPIMNGGEAAYETAEFKITSGSGYVPDAPDKATVGVYGDRPPGSTTQPNPYGDYSHNPLMDVFLETVDATAAEAGGDPGSLRIRYKHWSEDAGFVPPDPPAPMYILGGTAKEGEDYLATATRESVDH